MNKDQLRRLDEILAQSIIAEDFYNPDTKPDKSEELRKEIDRITNGRY